MSASLTLLVECSTPRASLALAGPDGIVDARGFSSDRHHNAALFGPLAGILASVAVENIGLVLVGGGPGSYSGTRVGIAAAQGVAIAAGCPAVTLPSLLATASARAGADTAFVGDARRGSYWLARCQDGALTRGPELMDAENLRREAEALATRGFRLATLEEPARFHGLGEVFETIGQEVPTAGSLWPAWQSATGTARAAWLAAPVQPIYLKPPHITLPKQQAVGGQAAI